MSNRPVQESKALELKKKIQSFDEKYNIDNWYELPKQNVIQKFWHAMFYYPFK